MTALQFLIIIGLSIVGVVSEVCARIATTRKDGMASPWFLLAVAIYLLLPIGWFPVVKYVNPELLLAPCRGTRRSLASNRHYKQMLADKL
jgi:hypothetical protein